VDASDPLSRTDETLVPRNKPKIIVHNKCDLLAQRPQLADGLPRAYTSALTGTGLDDLLQAIANELGLDGVSGESGVPFTIRQLAVLREAGLRLGAGRPDAARRMLAVLLTLPVSELFDPRAV
jgi:tRNA U34 5-carboxymethylaminomethyl modifying GTPase MnmE/TrmE